MDTYEAPKLTEYGDLAELTRATTTGNKTDVIKGTPAVGFHILSCDPLLGPCFHIGP